MADGRIKINELPETALVKDNGIFIIENDTTTQKISLGSLINYIKEHEEIAEHFLKQSAVDSENGVAPLDSSRKIPSANLPFGSTENTVYDGALGQALSDTLSSHRSNTGNPHAVTKSQVGLSDVDNTADIAKPVSTLQQNAIDIAYANSNAYTDVKIAELIDGAPSTLDTLGEIAQALQEGGGISDALDAAIGSKASRAELDSHTENDTIHITASERTKWNSKMGNTEDAGNTTVTFSEAADLSNINSGEKTGSIMGKISKAISTLISHISSKATAGTFGHVKLSDTYQNAVTDGDAANGMGASQKALADAYSALNSNLTDSLGGITFGVDDAGNYGYIKAGADTVIPFKTAGTKIHGSASGSNSWTVNIKRNNPVLKVTGEGYINGSSNNHVTLGIYGAAEDNTIPYHVYDGITLPLIHSISLYAGMPTVEVDVSAYPRFVIYAVYGSATVNGSTRVNFLIEN